METHQPDRSAAQRLAQSIVDQIDGAVHASVAAPSSDTLAVVVSTDSCIEAIGEPCEGPTLAAWTTGRITRMPTVHRCSEFPHFAEKCRRLGISSAAAFPIKDSADRTTGVLTVTSGDHHGFGTHDLIAARKVAKQLANELFRTPAES